MVSTITGSKVSRPKANGVTMSNRPALAAFSKPVLPIISATAQPATMPSSTAILATKPRPLRTISKIATRTKPAMAGLSSAP